MILRKNPQIHDEQQYLDTLEVNNQAFPNDLQQHPNQENVRLLPANEFPIEIHPYLNDIELQNYDKYIIGTFPPISYAVDQLPININGLQKPNGGRIYRPAIPFFHGNRGNMWDLLIDDPVVFWEFDQNNNDERFNRRDFLIELLNNNRINYSDIIYSTQRAVYNAEDGNLKNIVPHTDLIKHILLNQNVSRILFNTGSPFSQGGIRIHQNNVINGVLGRINVNGYFGSFDLFFRACQDLSILVEFKEYEHDNWVTLNQQNTPDLNNTLKTKIIFKARLTVFQNNSLLENSDTITKEFYVLTPFSPAAHGGFVENPIIVNWLEQHQGENTDDLLRDIYQRFLLFAEDDKTFLYNLNYQ